jgi:hypothetical protein
LGNYYGQTSAIGIQNTDTANDVNVTVTFRPQGGTPFTQQHTIKAGASKIIDMGLDPTTFPDLWIGSATVTPDNGTTPLVASAMIYTSNFVYAYTGFTNTGTEWFLPLIRSEYAGLSTGVQVVSVGTANTLVTINYAGATYNSSYQLLDGNYTCTVTATLDAGSSITFYNAGNWGLADVIGASGSGAITGGTCATSGHLSFDDAGWFLGSATITTDGGDVAVMVNDANAAGTSSGAYNGFLATDAAASIISPLARVNFYGITSGTQVQNICSNSVTVSSVYKTGNGSLTQTAPTVADQTLDSLASYTYYIPTGGTYDGWLGSLTVTTADGNCLVGITNDAPGSGDASVFNTFAMP